VDEHDHEEVDQESCDESMQSGKDDEEGEDQFNDRVRPSGNDSEKANMRTESEPTSLSFGPLKEKTEVAIKMLVLRKRDDDLDDTVMVNKNKEENEKRSGADRTFVESEKSSVRTAASSRKASSVKSGKNN
jgi:hypothetical protein